MSPTHSSCRKMAYTATSLVLALFLAELKVPDDRIGLFMSFTILGDVVLTLLLTLTADKVLGRRRTLFVGSLLMIVSGAIFVTSENYWLLLLAAVVGIRTLRFLSMKRQEDGVGD